MRENTTLACLHFKYPDAESRCLPLHIVVVGINLDDKD
jgi:hypothetical protein